VSREDEAEIAAAKAVTYAVAFAGQKADMGNRQRGWMVPG